MVCLDNVAVLTLFLASSAEAFTGSALLASRSTNHNLALSVSATAPVEDQATLAPDNTAERLEMETNPRKTKISASVKETGYDSINTYMVSATVSECWRVY